MMKLAQAILWFRAQKYLKQNHPTLIGVAGSTEPSIAKEAVAAVLSTAHRVRSSTSSCPTRADIALSILGLPAARPSSRGATSSVFRRWSKTRALSPAEPDIIVLALGATKPGELDFLANQLPFAGAVVTDIQSTHLHLFTSKDLVAHEIASLVVALPADGFLILNHDDPLVLDLKPHSQARLFTYGRSARAHVRLVSVRPRGRQGYACAVNITGQLYELHLPHVVAEHHIGPILGALAVAYAMQINLSAAIKAVQPLLPPPGHMRLLAGYNNAALLDDSYDASPESTVSALDVLRRFPGQRKIAILGDILDLGAQTIGAHHQLGEKVTDVADIFVAVGHHMRHAGAAALRQSAAQPNQPSLDLHNFSSSRDVGKWLRDFLHPGDVVLIKGSRAMRLEEVTRRLLANPADEELLVK